VPRLEHSRQRLARDDAAPVLPVRARQRRSYGKSHILHDATLDVRESRDPSLCSGRNGAGKSTLIEDARRPRAVYRPGESNMAGADISHLPRASDIARAGDRL